MGNWAEYLRRTNFAESVDGEKTASAEALAAIF